jgi:hypothetical protein
MSPLPEELERVRGGPTGVAAWRQEKHRQVRRRLRPITGSWYHRLVVDEFRAWFETKLVKSREMRGSPTVQFQDQLIKTHAVAVDAGVPARQSVCGEVVSGGVAEMSFDLTQIVTRCGRCAESLGIGHVGR